jgi:hypothetical protein
MTACDSFSGLLDGRVRSGSDLSMEEVGKTITVYDLVWYTGICTEGYSNYEITITAGQPEDQALQSPSVDQNQTSITSSSTDISAAQPKCKA